MMKLWETLVAAFTLIFCVNSKRVSYEGYKLYEVYPHNEKQAQDLKILEASFDIHFLSHILPEGLINHPVEVLVSPNAQDLFNSALARKDICSKVVIENFERTLKSERMRTKRAIVPPGEINFDAYHRYEAINSYLKAIATKYSDIASVLNIGKTTEDRDIQALKISNGEPKPIILIHAGIHAREWIAPAQALYIIQELVENPDNDNFIRTVDWIIIPSLNPDGYEYSHTTDRLWRKTRSKVIPNCTGTDANRNFDFHWGEVGAESNECSDTYHGPYAFSEPETRAFRDLVLKHASQIILSVSFHSFSQIILYPWGYTTDLPSNAAELYSLGRKVAKAIENVSGTVYSIGAGARILYYASGDSTDWIRGVAGINLTYTIELPPSMHTPAKFQLPAKYIKGVVSETFEGIKVLHSYVENVIFSN